MPVRSQNLQRDRGSSASRIRSPCTLNHLSTHPGAAGAGALVAILVGLAFAGPRSELAAGTRVGGVDVGGLSKREAVARLDRLFEKSSIQPVHFVAGTKTYTFAANQLAVQPDWSAAVSAAERAGDGFGPLRGFRRLR